MNILIKIVLVIGIALTGKEVLAAGQFATDTLERVKVSVIELCRGGTVQGSAKTFEISGGGSGTVFVLKRLAELGLDVRLGFSQEEWNGIKAVVPEQWDQAAYNECVDRNFDRFLGKLDNVLRETEVKVYNEHSSSICGGQGYVRVIVFKDTARRAKREAVLVGSEIDTGGSTLRVGESITTPSNCSITLADTGFDHDFYARLLYRFVEDQGR
jgi:hypothetical protein